MTYQIPPLPPAYGHVMSEAGPSTQSYPAFFRSDQAWSQGSETPEAGLRGLPSDDDGSPDEDDGRKRPKLSSGDNGKTKATRGSKACLPCRRLKMRCVGAEIQPPCSRCVKNGHPESCTFEPSQRGKRRNQKTEMMAKNLEKMEHTLDTVLQSIRTSDPKLLAAAAGMIAGTRPEDAQSFRSPSILSPALTSAPELASTLVTSVGITVPVSAADYGSWPVTDGGHLPHMPAPASTSRPASPRLHSLPDNALNPLGLLAEASLGNSRRKRQLEDGDAESTGSAAMPGIADPRYFMPGAISILPLRRFVIENKMAPALLSERIVTPEEVVELFDIYFRLCSHQTCLLVQEIYTPHSTGARSPFLFTCICAVASRYYSRRPELYSICSKMALDLATDCITNGYKSVEIVQGFFLLALWSQPVSRYEQDRTWQFSGIALRLATDLNLNRKTNIVLPDTMDDATKLQYRREILNRERTWIYAWVCDRSLSTQLGKPATVQEDYLIRSCRTWYQQEGCSPFDIGICAMADIHRINARIVDCMHSSFRTVNGINKDLNYRLLMRSFREQLENWRADWEKRGDTSPPRSSAHGQLRNSMREFYHRYYQLVFLSQWLQHTVDEPDSHIDMPAAYAQCLSSATDLVEIAVRNLVPLGGLTHMTDSTLVFLTYGAAFLLKLTKPLFRQWTDEAKIMSLVQELADALSNASIGTTYGPALYAAFLRALLASRRAGPTRQGSPVPAPVPAAADEASAVAAANGGHVPQQVMGSYPGVTVNVNGHMAVDPTLAGVPMSAQPSPRLEPQQWQDDGLSAFWNNFLLPGFGNDTVQVGQTGYTADDAWQMPGNGSGTLTPSAGPYDLASFGLMV